MKRFFACFLSMILLLTVPCGCEKVHPLAKYITELREDIFVGNGATYKLKAQYGFKENPFSADGKRGNTLSFISFRLLNFNDNVTYNLSFDYDNKCYKKDFTLSPVSHTLEVFFPIENFNLKEFDVTIRYDSRKEDILMKSIVPDNAISYTETLYILEKDQPQLVDNFINQSSSTGEIHLRILVKNGVPYWYCGLIKNEEYKKALLIHGITKEILAIREIF